jgi:uncharacterized protein with FMN-binding domain
MGDDVSTRYGDLQLRITLSGDRITEIEALKLPSDSRRSQQISENAAPKLRQEALDAQSAQIDTVSGATYTSDGYRESLQSAIDRSRQ